MAYIPDRGHIVWINFDPQVGHEQARHRPALVLSPKAYNRKTSLCIVCPMSSQVKGFPFEVAVPGKAPSVVLADQVKSLDWRARQAKKKGVADDAILTEVVGKLGALIF